MQDLQSMLGDVVSGSSITSEGTMEQLSMNNADAQSILDEAQMIVEGQKMQILPEPPTSTIEEVLEE